MKRKIKLTWKERIALLIVKFRGWGSDGIARSDAELSLWHKLYENPNPPLPRSR